MTDLLKKAFDAASRLPEDEQDAVAEWLLAELASEEKWEQRFTESQGALTLLAREGVERTRERRDRGSGPRIALRSKTTRRFRKAFSRLPTPIKDRAREAYRRFVEDPDHPGLNFKRMRTTEPTTRFE